MDKNRKPFYKSVVLILLFCICFFSGKTYIFAKSISNDKKNALHNNLLLGIETEKYKYRFVTGIGYGYLYWLYNVQGKVSENNDISRKQTSSYNGIVLANKVIIWRPWGGIIGLTVHFPFGVTNGVYVLPPKDKVQIGVSKEYLVKENFSSQILKSMAVKVEAGANYQIFQENMIVNIGGGVALFNLFETFNASSAVISSVGVFLDSDLELQVYKRITLAFGIQAGAFFLPICGGDIVVSPSNKVDNFIIKTLVLFDFAATISMAFYL